MASLAGLVLAYATTAAFAIALLGQDILPAKYFNDASYIEAINRGTYVNAPDANYRSAAETYAVLGLDGHPHVVAFISISLFTFVTLLALPANWTTALRPTAALLLIASFAVAALYLAPYSKDTITLVVSAAVLWLSARRSSDVWVSLLLAAYALQYRSYWLLVLGSYWLFLLMPSRRRPLLAAAFAAILCVVISVLALKYLAGRDLSTVRSDLNAGRIGASDAATVIQTYLPGASWPATTINIIITAAFSVVPVPLIMLGGAQYAVAALFMAIFWIGLLRAYRSAMLSGAAQVTRIKRCFSFVAAFWVVQAMYVPDYGSLLKHLAPMLPIMISVILHSRLLDSPMRGATIDPRPTEMKPHRAYS